MRSFHQFYIGMFMFLPLQLFLHQKIDFDQRTAGGAPLLWSKYTTANTYTVLHIDKQNHPYIEFDEIYIDICFKGSTPALCMNQEWRHRLQHLKIFVAG